MARNLARSSSRWPGSSASASTRALKSSQLSSRLEKRSSGRGLPSGSVSRTASDEPPWNGSIADSSISSRPAKLPMPSAGGGPPSALVARLERVVRGVTAALPAVAREPLLAVTSNIVQCPQLGSPRHHREQLVSADAAIHGHAGLPGQAVGLNGT